MIREPLPTLALILFLAFCAPAQENLAGASQIEPSSPAVYPDTAEGLQKMLQDLFAAIRGGNEEQVSHLLQCFVLPNAKAWFTRVFGPEEGARLAVHYQKQAAPTDSHRREFYEGLARRKTAELRIERFVNGPDSHPAGVIGAVLSAMKEPVALYSADVVEPGTTGGSTLGYFMYVDGGFRKLGHTTLHALSTAPPLRIRVGGNVQAAKLIHKVTPRYPAEAVVQRLEGTVRLQVLIARDGTIQELKLLSGHPILAAAAVEAVRQWRHKPTLLNGLPVEVVTTIDVNFVLGR